MPVENRVYRLIAEPTGVPVWSPAGGAIAWASEDGLAIYDLEDQRRRQLSTRAIAGRPAWAPDGAAIAFVDRTDRVLAVVEVPTGQPRFVAPIANPEAPGDPQQVLNLGGPEWSPDGAMIAFTCWDGAGDELCTIGADGQGRRQLTQIEQASVRADGSSLERPQAIANAGPAAWSPDGRLVAVAVYPERRGAQAGLFVIDLARGKSRKVSPLQPNWEIAWFPDGSALLCSFTREGRSDVYRVSLEGGQAENLTAALGAGARYPKLDATGSLLAVTTRGRLVILNLENGSMWSVATSGAAKYPAWSGDGSAIAFALDEDPIQWYE